MATLYVENVPEERYKALRARARRNRRSIAAEVVALLEETVPTDAELKARWEWFRKTEHMRAAKPLTKGPFPSAEEMVREDRER
jgi:plasmid stability protein